MTGGYAEPHVPVPVLNGALGSALCAGGFNLRVFCITNPVFRCMNRRSTQKLFSGAQGDSQLGRKEDQKANIDGVEVPVWAAGQLLQAQCPALGHHTGASPAPWQVQCCPQDASALLLFSTFRISLDSRLIGAPRS